jgi:Domain of unknown function (DUF4173)
MPDRRRAAAVRAFALVAAGVAAWVIPGAPPGLGVVAVALLVAAAALSTAARSADLLLFGAPALVLASFAAVLDAQWVVTVDLAAAWLFATLAVGGARLRALAAPIVALPPGLPGLVPDSYVRALPALRAVTIGIALTVPFAVLFLTADAAFAAIADNTPRPGLDSLPARLLVFAAVLLGALGLALAGRRRLGDGRGPERSRRLSAIEWALPLGALDALFLAFVAVQVTVLFGGNDHVLRTTGLTYAEYAREGFWQLLAATALTLAVVRGATLFAAPRTPREALLLRGLLGLLCALTIVIVASALHRLRLYESAFGLTRPRVAAEAFALWLAGTFGLILLAGAFRRAANLPRILLGWLAVALVVFSLADPDGRIAERNVERWRETGRIDLDYASGLSGDAVPALSELPSPLRERVLARLARDLAGSDPWTSANLSRARARRLLKEGSTRRAAFPSDSRRPRLGWAAGSPSGP